MKDFKFECEVFCTISVRAVSQSEAQKCANRLLSEVGLPDGSMSSADIEGECEVVGFSDGDFQATEVKD